MPTQLLGALETGKLPVEPSTLLVARTLHGTLLLLKRVERLQLPLREALAWPIVCWVTALLTITVWRPVLSPATESLPELQLAFEMVMAALTDSEKVSDILAKAMMFRNKRRSEIFMSTSNCHRFFKISMVNRDQHHPYYNDIYRNLRSRSRGHG